MRQFSFGQTLAVTYPNHQNLAGFVVARNDAGQPYLICYNNNLPRLIGTTQQPLTQCEGFICEGVPFKVDNDDFALSVGEVTGKERDAIIPFIPRA